MWMCVCVDIDVCAADLHSCGPHQTCQSTGRYRHGWNVSMCVHYNVMSFYGFIGPSSHNCICQEPFTTVGAGCIPK